MSKTLDVMRIKIDQMIYKNKMQHRKIEYLILSEVTHSQLRREIVGVDSLLEMITSGIKIPRIENYKGMYVIILDSDDPDTILVG